MAAVSGAIAHAAVDARPDRVARVVYVDSVPLGDSGVINDELPVVEGEIPLPDWSVFEEEDLVDLDDELRERFRATAIPEPVRVATDRQVLRDPRRYDVPITVITCEFPSEMLRELMAKGHSYTAELAKVHDGAWTPSSAYDDTRSVSRSHTQTRTDDQR